MPKTALPRSLRQGVQNCQGNCVRSQNKASILEGIVLFSSADTKITLERLFCEFFSVKNQIKKVLYSMSPKTTVFCSKCEARRSSDWLRLQKTIHGTLSSRNGGLPPRFDFPRVRVAFSGLLAFTGGFSNWFYSGLKKRSCKKIENFWSKIDFEIEIGIFSKIIEIFPIFQKFSKNFRKIENFENFIIGFELENFSIFSKKTKIFENLDFFKNFEIFSISISKSIFDQKFSIFFHDLFFKPL